MAKQSARAQLNTAVIAAIRRMVMGAVLSNQRKAEVLGLHPTDLQILNILEMAGAATPKQLAEATRLTTGGITVALDRLELARYIKREANPTDRRSVLIHFLPKPGHPIFDLYKDDEGQVRKLLTSYTEDEVALIANFLAKLTDQ